MDDIRAKLRGEGGGALTEEELTRHFFSLSSSEPVADVATLVNDGGLALRQVCQYQFKRGDIAWLCRSCQKDETCVLCNNCWHNSNHEGHEAYYYHSMAGGCCDCGDFGSWNPTGFCSRHGKKNIEDPCSVIPESKLQAGKELIETIAIETAAYTSFLPSTFAASAGDDNFDGTENWSALLYLDDVHKPEDFAAELERISRTSSGADGFRLTALLKSVGIAAVAVSADLDEVDAVAQHFRARDYLCAVFPAKTIARRDNLVVAVNWLYNLVLLSDAVCRIFTSAISASSRLQSLVSRGCYLDKTMMQLLHNLLLSTMADQQFKENLSKAYADSYPELCRAFGMGIGLQECSFFSLSVQFLNRESFVSDMINGHGFFRNAVSALSEMLDNASTESKLGGNLMDDKCCHFRRYNPVLADLRIIFSILSTNRRFVTETLDSLLVLFSDLSGMHRQTRQLGHHVLFEDPQWIVAFNLYLGLGGLFESLCSWISSSKDAHINVPDENNTGVILLSASDFLSALLERLLQWLEGENTDRSLADYSYVLPSKKNTTFVAYLSNHIHDRLGEDEERRAKSFHWLLHRLFSCAILECTKSPALVDFLNSIDLISPADKLNNGLRGKNENEGSVFPLVVDHPLDSLAFGAEIRVGLWIRNGVCMRDQLVNFDEVPYCRIFKELDISLLQIFGAKTCKNECIAPLVARVFHRYGIYDYILGHNTTTEEDVTKSTLLFEEALTLFLVIITELPQPPPEDLAARALENMRREIIHRACAEQVTFSQLHDCTLIVSDHAKVGTGSIESLIREVTVQCGEPALSSMEEPKLSLSPLLWGEYNPVHLHLPARLHQACIETRPRVLAESPMVRAPSDVHPAYSGFRAVLLSDELLLASVRLHAVSYAAIQVSDHAGSAARIAYGPIRLTCRDSLWSRCLHFLTLIAHELDGADNEFREVIVTFLLFDCADSFFSAEATEQLTTIKALVDIQQYTGTSKPHSNNAMWLGWVLSRFASLDERVKAYIDERRKTRDAEERAKMLELRKQQARERSVQMMRSRTVSFAATMQDGASDDGEDDVGDSGAQSGGEHDQLEEDEVIMCIICHRHSADKDDRLGLQFLSQASQVCGRLQPRDSDTLHLTPNQLPRDPPNLFLSGCQHAMHFRCFDLYFADVVAQSEANNSLVLDTKVGQFLCPCCKRLSNCLVPHHGTRAAERLFKRARTDEAPLLTTSGEGGGVFDLVQTISVSAKSLKRGPTPLQENGVQEFEQGKEKRFWTRFLGQVTAPQNRYPLTPQFSLSLTSCAFLRRLEVAVAAVRYTVRCNMALQTFPGRSIAANQEAGLDEHAHLSSVIASIGSTMNNAGSAKDEFLDALVASLANPITGHAFADSVEPSKYIEPESSDWLLGFLLGLHRGILSLPTLDILVLSLSCCSDSPEAAPKSKDEMNTKVSLCLSSARLLSIASLVQICVAVVFDTREGADIYCDVDIDVVDVLERVGSLIDHIFESLSQTAHFGTTRLPPVNVVHKEKILRKWMAFLRIALEIIYRSRISGIASHPDAFFAPSTEAGGLFSSTYVHALGLEAYLFDDAPYAAATKHMITCWINSSVAPRNIVTLCSRGSQPFDIPTLPKPITFTRLPAAYTTLHAQVKDLASYDFPAICMTCAQILDAGGSGYVTAHCRLCAADGGAAFLLQESVMLLLHGDRASYFPSPFVDENGERGKLSRGKPLLWDDRRGALLDTLYAKHELGREIMQKRASSQRVILANYY